MYEDQSKETTTDNMCKFVIAQALPSEMRNQMHLKQLVDTFTELRAQMRDHALARKAWNNEAAPMSVDVVWGKGKDGKRTSYDKDYAKVTCNRCGEARHVERYC